MSKLNDVIILASGKTHINLATASCVIFDNIALGGDINIIRSECDGIFLAYYLNNSKKYEVANRAQGSSVIHLYVSHLKPLKLDFPCLEEQKKIGVVLSDVDSKVEFVVQEFKKGMLQKLFC